MANSNLRYFREIARKYETDHHEYDLNPESELQGAIEDFAYYSDEPSADAGALPVWYLSRMSRQHVTVALSVLQSAILLSSHFLVNLL